MIQNRPLSVLKEKSVLILISSLFISSMSNQMQIVAMNWHMYEKTHSPVSLGLLGLAGFLPILIFSLPAGTLVDKMNKKKILILTQIVLSACAILLFIQTILGIISPITIYIIFAINAAISTFTIPSRQAILSIVVPQERLINAISIQNIAWEMSLIFGPTIAGFVIGFFGIQIVYLTAAIFFLISLCVLTFLSYGKHAITTNVGFNLASIVEGISFVRKSPLVYSTMFLDFFVMFFGSAATLMPIFAKDILLVGAQGLGFLYAAPSVGAAITGIIISARHKLDYQGKLILGAVIIYGIAIVGFGSSKIFWLSLIFLAVSGAADSISAIIRNTIRQIETPNHLRGRMTAINMNFFVGGPFLGEIEAGFAAKLLGTPMSVALGGIGAIASAVIIAILVPMLRQYRGHKIEV